MKRYKISVPKLILLLAILGAGPLTLAQETKTYKESFKVSPDVVVELNTSHADIAFETWDKNQVEVEAIIELEGATPEEAAAYFKNGGVEILGNSTEVQVSTQAERWEFHFSDDMDLDIDDFDVVMPDIPDVAPMVAEIMEQLPEMPPMPPMPPIPPVSFDYEAYKKDGEKYMKKWQKEFEKEFDAEYRERYEEWAREMESRSEEIKIRIEEDKAFQEEMRAVREKHREEIAEQREQMREQMREAREQAREAREEARKSRVFYFRGDSGNRSFTIKKTIKIKMPKGARLKLNVRHGEVKLADNALNTKATLSYARLLATNIDGTDTFIEARYTPVRVKRWKGGRLQADYSEGVELDEVNELSLQANSSMVTIDRLTRQASIDNRMGALEIGSISEDFRDMVISVEYGELRCPLPRSAYAITVANDRSEVSYPDFISWDAPAAKNSYTRKGFSQQKGSGRSIVINAAYSDVKLQR